MAAIVQGCGNCGSEQPLIVTQELSAAVLDEIYAVRAREDKQCDLACDYGVKQEEGPEHAVLSLSLCQLDPAPDYEPMEPGEDPMRQQKEGGRIKCEGSAWVTFDRCVE